MKPPAHRFYPQSKSKFCRVCGRTRGAHVEASREQAREAAGDSAVMGDSGFG